MGVPRLKRVWDVSFLIRRSLRVGSRLLIGRPHESSPKLIRLVSMTMSVNEMFQQLLIR